MAIEAALAAGGLSVPELRERFRARVWDICDELGVGRGSR